VDIIKDKLLKVSTENQDSSSTALAAGSRKGSFRVICNHCGQEGHIKPRCPDLRKAKKKKCPKTFERKPADVPNRVLLTAALGTGPFKQTD